MAIDKIFDGAVDGIADNLFNSVSNSVTEIKAMQQRKAAENVQLVVQALKKIDADIREKYDGVTKTFDKRISNIKDGKDGKDGTNGIDGINGKDGRDGKDGRTGRDGIIGPRGFDGLKGLDGRDGLDGEDGVSIIDAQIDFDGSLTIILSNGNVINAGEIVNIDLAEKIKVITNGGGTSQSVIDTLASLQAQITAISAALVYKGTWNASTNTPTLASGVGTANSFYIVSVSGSTTLDGISNWGVGDWAVFNGSVWQRVEGGAVGNFTELSVSGVATFSAGTAGLPAITTTGDTNTGIWFPAADTVAVSTAGSERVRITSAGNVGIGTSSPASILDVTGAPSGALSRFTNTTAPTLSTDTHAGEAIFLRSGGTSASGNVQAVLAFGKADSTGLRSGSAIASVQTTADPDQVGLSFYTSRATASSQTMAEAMRIDAAGDVGIGTTSPTSTLSVTGSANVTGNTILGDSTSDSVTVNGYMSVGGAAATSVGVYITSSALASTNQYGVFSAPTGTSAATASVASYHASPATAASAFTSTNVIGFRAVDATKGAGSTITNAHGLYIADQTQGTNNYGITSLVSSGTNKWNIYASGTAQNYFAGKTGFATAAPAATVHVSGDTIISNVDVLNASYDSVFFSVAAEELSPQGLFFSPDGSKMFVLGNTGDDVNEYVLSTPWVVSSATYSTVFSVSGQDTVPAGLFFRADGLKMYMVGQTNDTVFQYALTSPWSVATASYESISFSVAVQEITPAGIFFKPNGLSMYVTGSTSDGVYQYTLSTAWNVSTATFLQTFSVSGQETAPADLSFTGDGTRMFVMGSSGDDVNVYNLTTPWDISTATFVNSFSVAAQDVAPAGLFIKPDGTKMYMVGTTNDTVYQYTVPSVEIQLTGTTAINGSATVAQDLTVNGDFNTSGSIISTSASSNSFAGNVGIGTTSPDANLTVNGAASFAAGTALLPSIARAGDLNTGIFFPAADTIAFSEGGAESMRIDSSRNVGIGASSPTTRLDVAASSGTIGNFQANFGGAGGIGTVTIKTNTSVSSGLTLRGNGLGATVFGGALAASVFNAENAALLFGTNATERMRIDSSGNVIVTSTGGLGYGTGSGGAVTQATSRTTGVTLNKTNGAITLVSAAGLATFQSFTVTNSTVAATDVVHVTQKSGTDLYQIFVTATAAGSFRISYATTGGITTEQPVFNFAVLKAVIA